MPPSERVGRARELLDSAMLPDANIFATLVRHEGLFRRWLPFGGKLMKGKLPGRDRELLILRTAWLCGAEYEWGQHLIIGAREGLTRDEMQRAKATPGSHKWAEWSRSDALLLRAVDEIHTAWFISDPTWQGLAERYETEQLIEVAFVVGHYHLLAGVLKSLGVQLDEGLEGFADSLGG